MTGLTSTHDQPHFHRGQLYTSIFKFELPGFFFRYFPPPPWSALPGFVGWLGHGGGWDCGLRLVVGRLFFSFFPLQHVDLFGRWSGGGWFCFDLLVVWGVSRVGVGWVLPICW